MDCPRCQHNNPQGARFCEECATPLARICSNCGTALSATAKFCHACAHPVASAGGGPSRAPDTYTPRNLAEKILTSRAALEGERKQVTVLFADLKGSMELLADRDPEEARKLLDPVLELMMEAVHRYEGTVNQVMGDGIMALFGAPLAHEDHALRACYASLRMQEAVRRFAEEATHSGGLSIRIRIGMNSGEVVVRSIGSDLRMDYTAVGETTHLAARMEQLALAGTILMTRHTAVLVEDFVDASAHGPMEVKGLRRPVEVFELTAARPVHSRLHAAATRGLTRFVGRDDEAAVMRRALERSADRNGQVVAIVGEAGVGKSRLVWEFTHAPATRDWLVLEAAAVSYGKASGYLPIVRMLSSYFRIESRDDPRKIDDKVSGKLLSLDATLEPTRSALLTLLDVPTEDAEWARLTPPQRRRQILDALKRLLLRESQVQPLLLVIEDLHWLDTETQALLDALVDGVATARVLLLVTYRPEYTHAWASKQQFHQIRLDALTARAAEELLDALVGSDAGLGDVKNLLIERTEGNPFFLEEAVRALVETQTLIGDRGAYRLATPVRTLPLPATAQAVVGARIDRLEPDDKRLLQAASVVGRDVPLRLLQAVVGELDEEQIRAALDRLRGADFVFESQIFPEPEYTFKHALTHEVAYASVLGERRAGLHAALVGAHERVYADRLAEHVERVAHHAARGRLWEKAVVYAHAAGRRCIERSAYRSAQLYLEDAVSAAGQLPDGPQQLAHAVDVRLDLRAALLADGQPLRALELLLEAGELAATLGDGDRIASVATRTMHLLWLAGQTEQARESRRRALEHIRAVREPARAIASHNILALVALFWAEYATAEAHARQVIDFLDGDHARARGDGLVFPAVAARGVLAAAASEQGHFVAAIEVGEEAVRIGESLGHAHSIAHALAYLAYAHQRRGDHPHVEAVCRRGLDLIARTVGATLEVPVLRACLGHALVYSGAIEEGLRSIRDGVEAQMALGLRAGLTAPVSLLSEALLVAGRLDEALAEAERTGALAADNGQSRAEATYYQLLGDIAVQRDRPPVEFAEHQYQRGLTLASDLGVRPVVAHCQFGLGKLCRRTGKQQEAQEHLTTATTMYREMGMTYWLEKAETEMQEIR